MAIRVSSTIAFSVFAIWVSGFLLYPQRSFSQVDKATGDDIISADDFISGTFTNLSRPFFTEAATHTVSLEDVGDFAIPATNTAGNNNAFTVPPGTADETQTTITEANRFIENTGSTITTITVQAKDEFGDNLVSGGDAVTLSTTAGSFINSVTDNGDGTYTRTLQSTTNIETATITGTINGVSITDDAKVTFTDINTWQSSVGTDSTDWDNGSNWTLGIPTAGQAVIIPTNPANANEFPILGSNSTIVFLEIQSGAAVTVNPTFSLTITSDVSGSGTLIVDNGAATIGGDVAVANLNAGSSTVTLNGSDEQDITDSLVTDILIIENTSPAGIAGNNYVNAGTRLTVTNSKLTMQPGSTFEVSGNVTGNGRINSNDATFTIGGDVTIDTIDVSTSDVSFNGSPVAQTINNITGYLTVSNTSGVTHAGDADISQMLTISSSASLEVTGDLTTADLSAAAATLTLQGDFGATSVTAAPATVVFTGGNPQEIIDFDTFNNLTINKSASEVTSSDDVIVSSTLTLSSGDLVMGSGTNLLAPNRSLSGGQIRFQLELPSKGWYVMSAPVASTYSDFLDSVVTQGYPGAFYSTGSNPGDTLQPNVIYYDETFAGTDNQRWRTLSNASNSITEARGHFAYIFGDVSGSSLYTRSFPRTLDVGGNEFTGAGTEVDFNVTFTAAADSGWNLVGNPYGATIDWDDSGNWTKTNMDQTIYVWDHTANSGNGDYLVWNGSIGSLGNGLIAPFQGFWVKANAAGPVLKVHENAKTTGGIFRKATPKKKNKTQDKALPVIVLQLEAQELSSKLYFSFSEEASKRYDPQDAYRLTPFTNTFLEFFTTLENGSQFLINNMPRKFGRPVELPIYAAGFKEAKELTGAFTISWPQLTGIPPEWRIILEDRLTGNIINLKEKSFYSFDVKSSGDKAGSNGSVYSSLNLMSKSADKEPRFMLNIHPGADAGDLPSQVALDQNYPNPFNPSTTIRFGLPLESKVRLVVYDILGREIATLADRSFDADFHTITWNPPALASGVYLYRLVTEEKIITRKMTFIK